MIYDIQKASLLKRVSAFLLDIILWSIAAVGFIFLLSAVLKFDSKLNDLQSYYDKYETMYNIKFNTDQDEYDKLTDEEKNNYDANLKLAQDAISNDKDAVKALTVVMNYTLIMVTIGFLLASIILYVVIPLILKNGQTVGMKCFSLCLVMPNSTKVTPFALCVRAILGQFTIETMIPTYIIIMLYFGTTGLFGTIILLALLIVQIVLVFATKNHQVIHDLISCTVVVDKSSQMIFNNQDELMKYKEDLHQKEVQKASY